MRKYLVFGVLLVAAASTLVVVSFAAADGGSRDIRARQGLSGYEEIPTLSTPGNGTFRARISNDGQELDWTLTYGDLEGAVSQAHIHFGARATNGGIVLWLCGTSTNPGPAGTKPCPTPGGTVSDTSGPSDVQTAGTQGITAGEWDEFIAALRTGNTYANVHSLPNRAGGEIRGQLNSKGGGDDD